FSTLSKDERIHEQLEILVGRVYNTKQARIELWTAFSHVEHALSHLVFPMPTTSRHCRSSESRSHTKLSFASALFQQVFSLCDPFNQYLHITAFLHPMA